MIFNSIDFAIFLPIVFVLYWVLQKDIKIQNLFVVFASYVFYGWWDYRFLFLIIISTVVDYVIGLGLNKTKELSRRKFYLFASLFVNLGLLSVFKYFNFFIDNFNTAFRFLGSGFSINSLSLILPVGISFYTFQTLSYTIDVYRDKIKATPDFISFAAYVSFFPQLVAGPIEKATNLLPQFERTKTFDKDLANNGLRQILWGLVKKVLIADNCAYFANLIFDGSDTLSGSTLLLGAIFFTFQIYGDFSGYTDIAIGTAKLFGIRLKQNFAFPYFSRDISEFWRRWHISLSNWFKEYVYIPLGGSRKGKLAALRNTLVIFLISGFWHGANWTFIFWGLLNAIYFIPLMLTNSNRKNLDVVAKGRYLPTMKEFMSMSLTFFITVLAWILFRAMDMGQAIQIYSEIFSTSLLTVPFFDGRMDGIIILMFVSVFMLIEWIGRTDSFALETLGLSWRRRYRWLMYYVIIILMFSFHGKQQEFIYFQF